MQDLKVTIVQSKLYWEDIGRNLSMFSERLAAIHETTDLIVLPEMFSTGFSMNSTSLAEEMDGPAMAWMATESKKKNIVICGSLIIKEAGHFYNRLIWMRPDGSYDQYDKRHLFRMMNEQEHFSGGQERIIVQINGWRICPMICYDLRFPVWSRNSGDYDCLLFIANWPEPRREAWLSLLAARAHENQAYVIGVNRVGEDGNGISFSGDSIAFDPKGQTIETIEKGKEEIVTCNMSYSALKDFRKKFPVALDADTFQIIP